MSIKKFKFKFGHIHNTQLAAHTATHCLNFFMYFTLLTTNTAMLITENPQTARERS